ncbi:MAG: sensor histidine kinase [Ktedonobacteraceae bacterium]
MRHLKILPRFLLTLPFVIRLSIAVLCVIIFLLMYMMLAAAARNPSVLAIPMVLVAWMFRKRGVYICLVSIVGVVWIFYSIKMKTVFLPVLTDIAFIAGTLALLIIGLVISSQRDALDLANAARLQITRAYEQQQELNRIKDRFLQNVNHELRTPLTAVSGYIELMLEHDQHFDAVERATFLKNALYCCEELQLLVNNVLDTLQIEKQWGNLTMEELSVAAVVSEVIEHTDPRRLQEHQIHQDIPKDLMVWGNAQYVRQILRNLLSNAFKYAPNDTPIFLKAARYEVAGEETHTSPQVCISVQDAGPGIPSTDIPLLFGQFVRLQRDLSGRVRGTGLGLYISKQLVEALDGRIRVESAGIPGRGSCFYFTLRQARCVDTSAGEENKPTAMLGNQSVGSLPE